MLGVEPAFAGGDDTNPRTRLPVHPFVDLVGTPECLGGEAFVVVEPRLLLGRCVHEANVHAAFGQHVVVGQHHLHAVSAAVHDFGDLDGVLEALDPHPAPGIAAELPAQDPVVEHLLHPRGAQNRHERVEEGELRLVQHGR